MLEERLRTHSRDLASMQMLANLYMGMGNYASALDLSRKTVGKKLQRFLEHTRSAAGVASK